MPENVQSILNRVKEWWTKFSVKQRTLVVSLAAVVVLALVILVSFDTYHDVSRRKSGME